MAIAIKIPSQDDTSMLDNVAPDVFDDPIDIARTKKFLADPRHHLAVASENNLAVGFVFAVHYIHPDKPRPELWLNEVALQKTIGGKAWANACWWRYLRSRGSWAACRLGYTH